MKKLLKYFIALTIIIGTGIPANAQTRFGISIRIGPPPLPVYEQPIAQVMVIFGYPVIGLMTMTIITGFPVHGYSLLNMDFCGLLAIGIFLTDIMNGMKDIGAVM